MSERKYSVSLTAEELEAVMEALQAEIDITEKGLDELAERCGVDRSHFERCIADLKIAEAAYVMLNKAKRNAS